MPHRQSGHRKVDPSRYSMVPRVDVPRSAFDIRYNHKTTFDASMLVPVYLDEVLPGDSLRLNMTAFARLATPLVPIMDNLYMESFFFFVPTRLVWENWQRFMGERLSPTDTVQFLVPQQTIGFGDAPDGTLRNYMGLQNPVMGEDYNVSCLPLRCYNLIWNEWFRDQDLQAPVPEHKGDGPDVVTDYQLLRRGKRHDYFTSARPWPQKPINAATLSPSQFGGPFVPGGNMTFPQSGAPVSGLGVILDAVPSFGPVTIRTTGDRTEFFPSEYWRSTEDPFFMKVSASGQTPDVRVLVNDIRTAMSVQQMMERNARGGTRYTELIRSHFGVISPDARLQRPEFLGGGRTNVHINPVAQTAPEDAGAESTVLGELAGIGTAVANNHGFTASFTEHGFLLGLVNVRADLSYQAGVHRMWKRRTPFDFYWPSLAHLGEQAIMSYEIYTDGSSGDETVFGYQERWAEYRWKPNMITGGFSSYAAQTLDFWHAAEKFTSRPVLNDVFVQDKMPAERILQVDTVFGQEILFDSTFALRWVRPMPVHSLPGVGLRF